jgi:GDPmannose 4,6-dehydratase
MKTALITGITGQDGSYLAEFLLNKGYRVFGIIRRSSSFNTGRIDELTRKYHESQFNCFRGDSNDVVSLISILKQTQPDEIYNLSAQSHVRVSFDIPVYTFDTVATGTLNLLESVRALGLKSKIYQAGSSEMFGSSNPPQNENTQFLPRSPYAIAKVSAHHFCVNYREAYNMFISEGILFNHESPRRGGTFVTKKITEAACRIKLGLQECLYLGNIDSKRDWGFAPDYVEAMWRILQYEVPDNFVISTGESHTVREFVEESFKCVGITIIWKGIGFDEIGIDSKTGTTIIKIDKKYFRPTEADFLLGDSSKARNLLKWEPKVKFKELIKIMIDSDLNNLVSEMNNSKLFITKPWGYEHTVFNDDKCLIWRLVLKDGESTSYHCHPNKKTMLIVLKGEVEFFDGWVDILQAFDSKVIEKGEYHSSKAINGDAEIIEIDSPPLVTDIIRLKDKYGREGKDYYEDAKSSDNCR